MTGTRECVRVRVRVRMRVRVRVRVRVRERVRVRVRVCEWVRACVRADFLTPVWNGEEFLW